MAACRSRPPTSRRPRAGPGRAFCAVPSTSVVECMVLELLRLLAGRTGSTASFLDCLAAALQDLPRRRTPPRALETSRRGSRGAAGLFGIACGTDLDACRSLRGTRICALSVDTRASLLVEKSAVMRIATVMISYRVRCSDEYDTLAQDLIRTLLETSMPRSNRHRIDKRAIGCTFVLLRQHRVHRDSTYEIRPQ